MENLTETAASINVGDALAKLVYLIIVINSENLEYTASYGQIAKICGISKGTVSVKLQYLKENGLIDWRHNHTPNGNIKANTYVVDISDFT